METIRTYYIYDTIEKCCVKSGTNRRSLFRTADRMNYNYGGVRYVVMKTRTLKQIEELDLKAKSYKIWASDFFGTSTKESNTANRRATNVRILYGKLYADILLTILK